MRLPLIWTSTSSPGRPRSDGARTKLDASEMVFCPTKNDGTMFLTVSSRLAVGWVVSSVEPMTSIGEAELVTVRSVRRVPVMTISSELTFGGTGWAASAASATTSEVSIVADARSERTYRARLLVMKPPMATALLFLQCSTEDALCRLGVNQP